MKITIARARGKIIVVVVMAIVLLGYWGLVRAIDGVQQARLASSAVQDLGLKLEAVKSGSSPEIALLQGRVSFVKSQFDSAKSKLTPFIQIAPFLGWVPRIGLELRSAQDMLELGGSLAQASQDLLNAIEIVTFQTSQTNAQILQGDQFNSSILRMMTSAEPFFNSALQQLEQADATIRSLAIRDLPSSFKNVLASAQNITPSMERFARTGMAVSQLGENFLGYDRPRSYLLVAQNSDELRATGGFIPGAWILTLDQGEIAQLAFWDTVEVDDLDASPPLPPEGLLQSLWAGAWLFRDAGWYPDFPTSAGVMEQMFLLGKNISVDGVIAMDQLALRDILDVLGPITLYTGEILDSDSYLSILENNTDLFGHGFMDTALGAFLDRIREQGTDQVLIALLATLNKSLNEKHILVSFHDSSLQDMVNRNGWSGAVEDRSGDYLMVVDSNVGFSKVNRNIAQRISYSVVLSASGKSQARLDLLYTNQSSEMAPNSCAIQSSVRAGITYDQVKNTCYWDYLRVYTPNASILESSSPFPMPPGALYRRIGYDDVEETRRVYAESGKSVFAGLFNLEVGASKNMAFAYTLPDSVVQWEGKRLNYSLFLQKQPGSVSTPVEIKILLPDGYCVHHSTPGISYSEADEVQFLLNLDSDTLLELHLEPKSACHLPIKEALLAEQLPEGISRIAFASAVVEPATAGSALSHIEISPREVTAIRDQRLLFTAVALDSEGRPVTDAKLHWRVSNPAVGTISPTGSFVASSLTGVYFEGVQVSATSAKGNASASTTVTILTRSEAEYLILDSVIVYPPAISVRPEQTVGLGALGWDKRSKFVQNLQVQWSMSNPEAGSINQFGFFKAAAISGNYPDSIEVTVTQDTPNGPLVKRALASVTISDSIQQGKLSQVVIIPYRATLSQGQQINFVARALDSSGQPVRDIVYMWELTQPVAGRMVRPGVFVAGYEPGLYQDAVQTVATQYTPGGEARSVASVAISVVPARVIGDVSAVQSVPAEVTLIPGQRTVFTAIGTDSNGNAIQGSVEWEVVNPTAGSIKDSGVFKAGSEPGRYKDALRVRITQEQDGQRIVLETHATVNIVGTLDSLVVTMPIITLESGRSAWLYAVGYDLNGLEIPSLQFRWSVDNPRVGSVTPSGFFTAGPEPGSYSNAIKVIAVELDTG